MVAVVQTSGDLGNWQPHLHALVSRGGWTRDWKWVPVPFVDEHSAELLFRHKVMRLLQDEGLLTEERTELLLSWRLTGFLESIPVVAPPSLAAQNRCRQSSPLRGDDVVTRFFPGKGFGSQPGAGRARGPAGGRAPDPVHHAAADQP